MKTKILNGVLITFAIILLICSLTFTVLAYAGQIPFLPVKNSIVANASVINGIDYPLVDADEEYTLILSDTFDYTEPKALYYEFIDVDITNYIQRNSLLYLSIHTDEYEQIGYAPLFGYGYAVDNGYIVFNGQQRDVICGFGMMESIHDYDQYMYDAYLFFDEGNDCYVLHFPDEIGSFPASSGEVKFDLYSVPTFTSQTSTTESLTEILGNSITFSTSAITTSVKEVFEGLFVNENNTISNYATYVVWFSGIAIALGFFKYVLRFILTLGDKK